MPQLMDDAAMIDRILDHADNRTTDLGEEVWREPVDNYRSEARFAQEIELLKRVPTPFCPSAALPENGSYVARTAAGVPLVAVRGDDGIVRVFHNACRHRGMQVAEGSGNARAFVCRYHAWAYGLDGQLKHVPGTHGFPDFDMAAHGLMPVRAEERGGLVWVTQKEPISDGALADLPDLIAPDQAVFDVTEIVDDANWKVLSETSMEGYHIKALHRSTFYPYGYDNLNVVETFGPNSRVTFPFRRIEKLRDKPRQERRVEGMLTYVYQLFPNARISVLSSHYQVVILEPLSPGRALWTIYRLTPPGADTTESALARSKRDAEFVKDTGVIEDREAACAIQKSLAGEGNTHFIFGLFEKSAVHFHRHLDKHLALLERA
jgi:choline monooxygenase